MFYFERIGPRRLIDRDTGSLPAVEGEILTVSLCADLYPADIAYLRDFTIVAGFDDYFFKFCDVGKPALQVDGILKVDAGRRRRCPDLAGSDIPALLLQRMYDILGVEAARLEFVGIEPDAHRILAGAEHIDVADARQSRQFILEIDRGVISQIEAVVAVVR